MRNNLSLLKYIWYHLCCCSLSASRFGMLCTLMDNRLVIIWIIIAFVSAHTPHLHASMHCVAALWLTGEPYKVAGKCILSQFKISGVSISFKSSKEKLHLMKTETPHMWLLSIIKDFPWQQCTDNTAASPLIKCMAVIYVNLTTSNFRICVCGHKLYISQITLVNRTIDFMFLLFYYFYI